MIRIMLCTINNCIAKDNFHLTMFETDNIGILLCRPILVYLFIV